MKFIKYAVGLVIALSVIPLVVITVNNVVEPRLKTVEFEVIDYDSGEGLITFSENTYNDIHSLAIVDTNNVNNLIAVKLNGNELSSNYIYYSNGQYSLIGDGAYWATLTDTNIAQSIFEPTIGDKWEMTFEVPNPTPLPPLIKLLVGFAPLLFVGGVLIFMLNKRKLD